LHPFIKDRIAKLRQAGIKPTLKRVIFLQMTLSKYQPLLHPADRPDAAAAGNSNAANSLFPQDFMTSVSASSAAASAPVASARIVTGTVTSVPIPPHAPPALLRLTAKQIGDCVSNPQPFSSTPHTFDALAKRLPPSAPFTPTTASSSSTTASLASTSLAMPKAIWPPHLETLAFRRNCTSAASWTC
jgi:hypothetical protein